ncbi:MAG: biotin transporter BioY [Clostridiaceae bacterium]|nr:biotin transporter BioY [Clostridiaceae bacterium]
MKETNTKNLIVASLMTTLMCILSPWSIPVGPIPVTLGVFCVFLSAMLLPGYYSLLSIGAYIGIALMGLPVCSGFNGGTAAILGPTGGYIVGYIFIAFFTALGKKSSHLPLTLISMLAGLACCYAVGTAWFMFITGRDLMQSLALCVIPFIPFDIIKGAASVAIRVLLRKRIRI